MESPGDPATLGDLLLTLYEMGFSERQVRDALHAGCLSAPEAANWLLQERRPEMKLPGSPWAAAPDQQAMDAFNPPRRPPEAMPEQAAPGLGNRAAGPPPGLPEVSLGRSGDVAFADQQREQLAAQLKAERENKRREHRLALQRITDDRRRIQGKAQLAQALPSQAPLPKERAQLPGDGQCWITIRLPTGDALRERSPVDSTLESLRQRILAQHPELSPSCSFLQNFPKRHFAPSDLLHSLQALGLAPSATLCVVDAAPEPPASERPVPPSPSPEEAAESEQQCGTEERAFPPTEGAPPGDCFTVPRGDPGSALGAQGHQDPAPSLLHHWGKGQRLESEEPMEEQPLGAAVEGTPRGAGQPREAGPLRSRERAREIPRPQHRWPAEGNLLRPAEGFRMDPLELPVAVAQAAELRLQQAAARDHGGGAGTVPACAPGRPSLKVPSLFQLSLGRTVALLSAPCRPHCRSLGTLTPTLGEHLVARMTREGLLNPRTLRLFLGCPLQKLLLDCYPYATNELLRQLAGFPTVRHLSLVSCSVITDGGLSVLQHLPRLQHLNLSACPKLTDRCLQGLKGCPKLSHLALDQTRVSDQGLAEFLRLEPPSLTHLSLNQTGITDRTLRLLPSCAPRLCVLSVKQTGVTDVSALRQLEALQALHLDGTCVSEASLAALSSHPSLSSLTLSGVRSVDGNRALELISGLPLVQVSLPSRHTVTDAGLAAVCHLVGLLELDLTDYSHITDQGLQHLPQLGRLRRLLLSNTQVTDSGLRHIQGLPLMEELCLDRLRVSSVGVARCIVTLPHLQVLSVASTPVGDTVARLGVAHCKHLHKLNLSRTRLTDRGLRFLRQVPLVQLNLDGSGVTAPGVADFLAACPTVTSIRMSHLRTLAPEDVSDEEGAS